MLKIGLKNNFPYIHQYLETRKIHNLELMSHGMIHIANFKQKFFKQIYFQLQNAIFKYKGIDYLIHLKLKSLHLTNIWMSQENFSCTTFNIDG